MFTLRFIAALLAAFVLTTGTADARRHKGHHIDPNGNKVCEHNTIRVSTAYNIDICVDPRFASNFQTFFASLKDRGCKVTEIVCQAYGHVRGSNHIGGGACDVDQKRKNVTTAACMYHAGDLIRAAGLYDGCSFRDCGHVEAMRGLGNYGGKHYAKRRSSRQIAVNAPAAPVQASWPLQQ